MATERLSMRAIREILRQRWVQGQPHRAVALSTGRSVGAVYETLRRAAEAGLDWERVQGLTDDALDAALYRRLTMRQVHRGGAKGFVDYAGKKPCLTDPATGERIPVELFVIALGASSYTYAEATATQQL